MRVPMAMALCVVNNPMRYTDSDGREHVQEPGFTKPMMAENIGDWSKVPAVSWAFRAQGALLMAGPVGRGLGTLLGLIRRARNAPEPKSQEPTLRPDAKGARSSRTLRRIA